MAAKALACGQLRCLIINRGIPNRSVRCFYALSHGSEGEPPVCTQRLRVEGGRNSYSSGHQSRFSSSAEESRNSTAIWKAVALGLSAVVGGTLFWKLQKSPILAAEVEVAAGKLKPGLPTYSKADVAKHSSKADGVWVTYKNGVYDVTEYVSNHPGGSKILLAAGKSMEPFWNMYAVHKNPQVYEILEGMRIGNITEVEPETKGDQNDPYKNDPQRSPILIPASLKPFNGEPPAQLLVEKEVTPSDIFFVRNHLPVPSVNPSSYCLSLGIEGNTKKTMDLQTLKRKFVKKTQTVTVQCAGNRRSEMVKVKEVKGLNWNLAAISTADWSGATLHDVLKAAGIDLNSCKCKYIVFEGMDIDPEGQPYGASIPIEKARALQHDIILAYEMNGADIPPDHGYPVRVIIPGVVGARMVKWLNRIYLSDEESRSHWQRRDYKGFNTSVDWNNVNFDNAVSITELPVTSAICEPANGTELEPGAEEVTVKGYAWSGGGRGIVRVDVSVDGGKTWLEADLAPTSQSLFSAWAWRLWEATLPLPSNHKGKVEVICKAVDSSYNVQPEKVDAIWNLRGVLSTAWHRIQLSVPPA